LASLLLQFFKKVNASSNVELAWVNGLVVVKDAGNAEMLRFKNCLNAGALSCWTGTSTVDTSSVSNEVTCASF